MIVQEGHLNLVSGVFLSLLGLAILLKPLVVTVQDASFLWGLLILLVGLWDIRRGLKKLGSRP